MKVNQCLKTGATVYLTQEDVEVHGDLHFTSHPGDGVHLVLNYVTPMKCVGLGKDEPWPEKYDAVFDTLAIEKDETQGYLDISNGTRGGVMICHAQYSYLHPSIKKPEGYGSVKAGQPRPDQMRDIAATIASMIGQRLGGSAGDVDVKVLRIDKDGQLHDDDEERGTLQ